MGVSTDVLLGILKEQAEKKELNMKDHAKQMKAATSMGMRLNYGGLRVSAEGYLDGLRFAMDTVAYLLDPTDNGEESPHFLNANYTALDAYKKRQ